MLKVGEYMTIIKEKLEKIPNKPGVYLMMDKSNNIIYVGKAKSLKKRVRQYFRTSSKQGMKVQSMVNNIKDFEYILVDNEIEALILESNLIKKHKPRYNILLRDDKQYPYIKITTKEKFPKVIKVREVKKDGSQYYGPYPSAGAVNNAIEVVHDIYPIRTCKLNLNRKENIGKYRPCLNYYINRCKAPCQGYISSNEYKLIIEEVINFFKGNTKVVEHYLNKKMLESSKNLEFEEAAKYRDKIESIKLLKEEQKIVNVNMIDQDIIGLSRGIEEVCIQVFFVRDGKIVGREHFFLEDEYGSSRDEILSSFIKQFYIGSAYIPKEIIIDTEFRDIELVEKWLSEKRGHKSIIHIPKRGDKLKLLEMVNKNARDMLEKYGDKIIKKQRDNIEALTEIKDSIGLSNIPLRIESYDISNISGKHSVGSMVVFEKGNAKYSDYRRFKIKTVEGPNDYLSMKEILTRRFKRGIKERETMKRKNIKLKGFSNFPDLIMMDGGKGQVNVALKVLEELGLDIEVVGLVKDEFHETRGIIYKNEEFILPTDSKGYRLIYKIQSEAHRYAINYHRSLRSKDMFTSQLDGIPHIGDKRKKELMRHFKSISKIKNASLNELKKVKSMNSLAAESIYTHFKKEEKR